MTTAGWTALAAGAAGVLVLTALGVWLFIRTRPRRVGSPENAADAADTLPDFVTTGAVVGSDGMAALAVDGGGRVAAVVRRGKRLRVVEIGWSCVHATHGGMAVETGAPGIGRVVVAGIDHLDVRRLAPVLA